MAHCLLQLNILCTGTTRKNAAGVLEWLIELKDQNRTLIWDSAFAEVVEKALCFLWQDNNAVLGIIISFSLQQKIFRERKRLTETSINV